MSRYLLNLLGSVAGAVEKVGWVEVIDVLIVAVILYQLLKLVRGTRAAELIVGLVLLSLVGVIASTLKLILLGWLFTNAAPFVVIALIVLFQPELRRALDQVGRLSHLNFQLSQFNPQAFNRGVAEAIRAAERLSARKTGALIVFEREVGLEDYAMTGVRINGELTAEFLQTIFFPNSPLHDGAVIVRGNMIARCRRSGCGAPSGWGPGIGRRSDSPRSPTPSSWSSPRRPARSRSSRTARSTATSTPTASAPASSAASSGTAPPPAAPAPWRP